MKSSSLAPLYYQTKHQVTRTKTIITNLIEISQFEIYNLTKRITECTLLQKKRIKEAMLLFPESANSLKGWHQVISKNTFKNFAELKNFFGRIDKIDNLYVFDIGGNKIRLIASIHFNCQRIYVRHILNHINYDKGQWKNKRNIQ